MSDNSLMQNNDSLKVAIFLFKWRKTLLIIAFTTAILSAFFSSSIFIRPLYKSTAIMYPALSNSISKSLLSENTLADQDILQFGEDEQTEQMLQILNSNRIRDKVVKRFDLAEHYKIDTTSRYHYTRLYNHYKSNITFKRTEYMAVKIVVLDHDPQMAANIANCIVDLFDSVKNEMQIERAMQGFRIVEDEYKTLQAQILAKEDSLSEIRRLGVHDYETQAEMLNQQLAIEIARGNTKGINALNEKFKLLAQYGGSYVSLSNSLEYDKERLSAIEARYSEAKIDATQIMPQKFLIENAYKAERKTYPVIWIIVVLSTIGALLMGILTIISIEKYRGFIEKVTQSNH